MDRSIFIWNYVHSKLGKLNKDERDLFRIEIDKFRSTERLNNLIWYVEACRIKNVKVEPKYLNFSERERLLIERMEEKDKSGYSISYSLHPESSYYRLKVFADPIIGLSDKSNLFSDLYKFPNIDVGVRKYMEIFNRYNDEKNYWMEQEVRFIDRPTKINLDLYKNIKLEHTSPYKKEDYIY